MRISESFLTILMRKTHTIWKIAVLEGVHGFLKIAPTLRKLQQKSIFLTCNFAICHRSSWSQRENVRKLVKIGIHHKCYENLSQRRKDGNFLFRVLKYSKRLQVKLGTVSKYALMTIVKKNCELIIKYFCVDSSSICMFTARLLRMLFPK